MLAAAALWYLLAFVGVAWRRLPHPYQLEWMEGGSVEHVRRILSGDPLYPEPAIEFVPFIYTPLYFYVGAALAWLTETELVLRRAIRGGVRRAPFRRCHHGQRSRPVRLPGGAR